MLARMFPVVPGDEIAVWRGERHRQDESGMGGRRRIAVAVVIRESLKRRASFRTECYVENREAIE